MMEIEYLSNGPKTYGIVYKDTAKVINYRNTEMYFRSKDIAHKWKETLEPVFCDSDLEVIQFEPTATEKRNKELIKDLSHDLSFRRRNVLRKPKNNKIKHSNWLSYIKKEQKKYEKEFKELKKLEKQQEENEEDYF